MVEPKLNVVNHLKSEVDKRLLEASSRIQAAIEDAINSGDSLSNPNRPYRILRYGVDRWGVVGPRGSVGNATTQKQEAVELAAALNEAYALGVGFPENTRPDWEYHGQQRCNSMHGNEQCEKACGHEGPHQAGKEIWNHS